jgi:release factor glutamine methyltransferase
MTVRDLLRSAVPALQESSMSAELDAELLLGFCIERDHVFVLTHPEYTVSAEQYESFANAVEQRRIGIPVAYITHRKEFYGRDFYVDRRVLVPRPETELLVEAIKKHRNEQGMQQPHILDIGTGSGCIAVTLACELADAEVTATDISADAIEIAQKNAQSYAEQTGTPITFYTGNLFAALPDSLHHSFDVIVSNPPYLPFDAIHSTAHSSIALQHEPQQALTPGADVEAHDTIKRILENVGEWLKPHGALFIEIGHDQGTTVQAIAQRYFPEANITIQKDLGGFDRVLYIHQS